MVDGLVGERTARERWWRDARMDRADHPALTLPALPPFRAAAQLLELAATTWSARPAHPSTDTDLLAARAASADGPEPEPTGRLAVAWLRLPGVPDRADRALARAFGDDPEAAPEALRAAWSLVAPAPAILWQADDAAQARDSIWLLDAGAPWPAPTAVGMDPEVFEAVRSTAPRAADRLTIETVTPAAPGIPEQATPATGDAELVALRDAAREALRSTPQVRDPLREGAARSAAEAFLAAVLARRPRTAGRFVLNGEPGFAFGPGPCHVDLLARASRIALEIDGPHHFLDDEAFRRDRRKDLLLQRHGYAVLRVLAADVVERLEEVLQMVDQTLDWRETRER